MTDQRALRSVRQNNTRYDKILTFTAVLNVKIDRFKLLWTLSDRLETFSKRFMKFCVSKTRITFITFSRTYIWLIRQMHFTNYLKIILTLR